MLIARTLLLFYLWLCLALVFGRIETEATDSSNSCIFKLSGSLVDCAASVEEVEKFNNVKIFPVLQSLLQQNYFRYYKVNMNRPCPMWTEDRECSSKECGIKNCDEEVPAGLRTPRKIIVDAPNMSNEVLVKGKIGERKEPTCQWDPNGNNNGNKLDPLDKHISSWQKEQFVKWAVHDESQDNRFCDVDDEDSTDMHYVDLQRNPERYTGYKGNSATRVWKAIYEENCFKPDPKFDKQFLLHPTLTGLCLEKRVFYRLISGLHTSITISIAAHNYKPAASGAFGKGEWVRNVDMFRNRFMHPLDERREGLERLKNLYFVYLLEMRALQKLAPYLRLESYFTGIADDDRNTGQIVDHLLDVVDQFPTHFDESPMFKHADAMSLTLREEFRRHFVNISRIMDCVGCDKCRLWGKLQTHGIGTALKILFAGPDGAGTPEPEHRSRNDFYKRFQLQRNDLVALLNSLGRFGASIAQVQEFRQLLNQKTEL